MRDKQRDPVARHAQDIDLDYGRAGMQSLIGGGGSGAGPSSASGDFYAVHFLTDTVLSTFTAAGSSHPALIGVTIPGNTLLRVWNLTNIALTSGVAAVYNTPAD